MLCHKIIYATIVHACMQSSVRRGLHAAYLMTHLAFRYSCESQLSQYKISKLWFFAGAQEIVLQVIVKKM